MSNLIAHLQLIEVVQKRLREDSDPGSATKREELTRIYECIKKSCETGDAKNATEDLLPEYMKSNPDILATTSEELVREVLKYVSGVCDYYRMIKTFRPLTDEERALGRKLSELLRGVQELP